MRISLLIIFIMIASSCTSTSGVIPMGDNKYLISRSEKGFDTTGSAVKADAIREANTFCVGKNMTLNVIEQTQRDMVPFKSDAQAEITFTCTPKINKTPIV